MQMCGCANVQISDVQIIDVFNLRVINVLIGFIYLHIRTSAYLHII
ncbi:MAG: hypothetical protein JWR38_125 [Mucilaginibacter sp.]|nr:hypothetical protein [Mucilaginibacter sp.]